MPNASTDKTYASVKRRRHKTVHFGDNLLLQVCANANMTTQNMAAHKLEPNVQQLFSFIEAVLSAWVTEEGLTSQGEVTVEGRMGTIVEAENLWLLRVRGVSNTIMTIDLFDYPFDVMHNQQGGGVLFLTSRCFLRDEG